jgi:PLP dependent protein
MSPLDADVARRLVEVRHRIADAGGSSVRVVAVTKTWGIEAVLAAIAAGCDGIGENYAQELIGKLEPHVAFIGDVPVHFIGRLQTNKVRLIAPFVSIYETVDRESIAREIAKRVPGAQVLIQTVLVPDPSKGGCPIGEAQDLVTRCRDLGLAVCGLMTVGPTAGGPEAARPAFRAARSLLDRLDLDICSMGMSDDLEVAVQEGSTEVRIGSALFGPRPG